MTFQGIKEIANRLVKKNKTRDPFEIAKETGIEIEYADLGRLKGMYVYLKRNRFIVLNNNLPESMQRIVCAHELGHDRLHRELAKEKALKEFMLYDMSSRPEYEANLFAAELLLPEEEILELAERGYDIAEMALSMGTDINLLSLKLASMVSQGSSLRSFEHRSDFLK